MIHDLSGDQANEGDPPDAEEFIDPIDSIDIFDHANEGDPAEEFIEELIMWKMIMQMKQILRHQEDLLHLLDHQIGLVMYHGL